MSSSLDTKKFSEMLKSKRGNVGLRALSAKIGISPSTLSRIEQGKLPDIDTYLKICEWLDVSTDFFKLHKSEDSNIQGGVIAHLRADKTLSAETSEALIQMINIAYAAGQKENSI